MFRHKRSADDFAQEIQSHLELEAEEWRRQGVSEEEARRRARRDFGSVAVAEERFRLRGHALWFDNLLHDLRFALRQMRRAPGFVLAAAAILALGIAANVVVFGVLRGLILQPLHLPHPDRVFTFAHSNGGYPVAAYPEMRDVRDSNTVFSAVAAQGMQVFGLEIDGTTRPIWGNEVSGQYFEVMAIQPALGRLLNRADDDHPGASYAAVLSWSAWKTYFHSDPGVVGKIVRINKHPYTIVGVTPKGFYGTEKFLQSDLFVPMANEAALEGVSWLEDRQNMAIFPLVRLKDGVSRAQAQAELAAIATRIARTYPKDEAGLHLWLAPPGLIGDFVGRPARAFLAGVMVLAGILLLAACANLGSLFAARTADRTREVAIRIALGSSRSRIVRQLLMEALLTSFLGGIGACVLSWITLGALAQWHPPTDYPIHFQVEPTPTLILVAFLIATVSGLLFGIMPLRQIFRTDPNEAIKSGGMQRAAGRRRWALRDILLAIQVALCCVTVTAAFVSLRGFNRSLTVDKGFNPDHATLTRFDLSHAGYSGQAAEHLQRRLLDMASTLPGVTAAGYADGTPLEETNDSRVFSEQTTDFRPTNQVFAAFHYNVSPGYLAASQTPLLEGRDIRWSDTADTPLVAIVNQQFARHLFKSEHAVGRYFKNNTGGLVQIIGIVPDGKYFLLSEDPQEAAYFPILQHPSPATSLIVRLRPDAAPEATNEMAATIRKRIYNLDPAIPLRVSSSWYAALAFTLFPSQVATVCLGLFGAFGLLLSLAGTFGLASYTVSRRLRELSIRVALGARARQVLSASLGRMSLLLGVGSAVGLLLGIAASRVLSAIVYQATARDPFVLAAVACAMLLTGALAVANPVRRALRVNPARLLREE